MDSANAGAAQALKVLVADDDVAMREAMRGLLESDRRFHVVASVGSAADAAAAAGDVLPDLAVVDVRMPGGGDGAVAAILACSPATVVLACTGYDDVHTRAVMLAAGVRAVVVKGADDLLDAACRALGLLDDGPGGVSPRPGR